MNNQLSRTDGEERDGLSLRAFVIGFLLTGWLGWYAAQLTLEKNIRLASTQVPTTVFVFLVVAVLLVNPVLRRVRLIRPFAVTELLLIFIMGSVSIGIAVYGTMGQLIPLMSNLYNRHFNTAQARWDLHLEPFLNEDFFIAEKGIQAVAIRHRESALAWTEARALLDAAGGLTRSRDELNTLNEQAGRMDRELDDPEVRMRRVTLQRRIELAEETLARAQARWAPFEALGHNAGEILSTYPGRVAELGQAAEQNEKAMSELREKAFQKVDVIRRGLPDDLRAVPGILYVQGEGMDVYMARLRRTRSGVAALQHVREAIRLLSDKTAGVEDAAESEIGRAREKLDPLVDDQHFQVLAQGIMRELQTLETDRFGLDQRLNELSRMRRVADSTEFARLDDAIGDAKSRHSALESRIAALTTDRKRIEPSVTIAARVESTRDALRAVEERLAQAGPGGRSAIAQELADLAATFHAIDASYGRLMIGDAEWSIWGAPLLRWAVIILLSYVLFISLNVIVFRQWAHHEKLTYPLAELPTVLSGAADTEPGRVPAVFRSGLFWTGAAIVCAVHGWNYMQGGVLYRPIQLLHPWSPFVTGTMFDGLGGAHSIGRTDIIFTIFGLTFLIPARISFSLWFFHLLFLIEILVLVWLGYGENFSSFPWDWNHTLNFRSAQGGGALLVFAAVLLWKSRRYFACAFAPGVLDGLEDDERKECRIASATFIVVSVALIASLCAWMGANLWYTILFYIVIVAVTIAMTRAVAEGGIPSFQCWFGPLHLVRNIVGLNHSWAAPSLFAPLMIYYLVLYTDMKTFLAPAIANAMKIRDNVKMSRIGFHAGVLGAMILAFFVTALTSIIFCYQHGADAVNHPWFYKVFPDSSFNGIKALAELQPVDTVGAKWWLLGGAGVMAALIFLRGHLFWLPHPLGLIMLVNPLIGSHWFSIFLGWACKSAIGKYGGRATYLRVRNFFIGIVVAEVLLVAFGMAHIDHGW